MGAYAVSEPGAGSDVSKIRTRATKVDGGWLLNGEKIWITNGGIADVHIIVATVDPKLGHRGQASFLVTADADGFTQTSKTKKLGIRASHTAELALQDVFVPDDQLLGGGILGAGPLVDHRRHPARPRHARRPCTAGHS